MTSDQIFIESQQEISETKISKAIYGLMTVLAVLQALQLHPVSARASAASLFGTTLD